MVVRKIFGVDYYGTKMETNVFDFTLLFSSASLFSRYDILQVPLNLGSRESAFFCESKTTVILRKCMAAAGADGERGTGGG